MLLLESVLTRQGAAAQVDLSYGDKPEYLFLSFPKPYRAFQAQMKYVHLLQEAGLTSPATLISPYLSSFCPSSEYVNEVADSAQ